MCFRRAKIFLYHCGEGWYTDKTDNYRLRLIDLFDPLSIREIRIDLRGTGRLQSPVMRFYWPATKKIAHRLFAILLLLWWGGLNCLAGCLTAPTNVTTESLCTMSAEGGDCCLTQATGKDELSSKSIGSTSTSTRALSCCSLESLSAEVGRDVRAAGGAATTAIPSRIEFTPERHPRAQLPDRWVRLPDRGGTHLLHCVFLI